MVGPSTRGAASSLGLVLRGALCVGLMTMCACGATSPTTDRHTAMAHLPPLLLAQPPSIVRQAVAFDGMDEDGTVGTYDLEVVIDAPSYAQVVVLDHGAVHKRLTCVDEQALVVMEDARCYRVGACADEVERMFAYPWTLDELARLFSAVIPLPASVDETSASPLPSGGERVDLVGPTETQDLEFDAAGRLQTTTRRSVYGAVVWALENDRQATPADSTDLRPYWLIIRVPHRYHFVFSWKNHDEITGLNADPISISPPAGYATCPPAPSRHTLHPIRRP